MYVFVCNAPLLDHFQTWSLRDNQEVNMLTGLIGVMQHSHTWDRPNLLATCTGWQAIWLLAISDRFTAPSEKPETTCPVSGSRETGA